MKSKEEIKLMGESYATTHEDVSDRLGKYLVSACFQDGYTQCQEDIVILSDKVLFEQATVAMEEMYGYGCETEIDAYFRGLKWMQKQFNKQD